MQNLPKKQVLTTPSASPPAPSSPFPQPVRISDQTSSRRKRVSILRYSRTPSSNFTTENDLRQEREASTTRLLDVWSQLAERYTRRLDEDDIVDITTGNIIKDNGFLRNIKKLDFGMIAEPDDGEDAEEDGEEDIDELDAFAENEDEENQGEQSLKISTNATLPVPVMDGADEKDLREFLEAERQRKEICGSEPESDESDEPSDDVPEEDNEDYITDREWLTSTLPATSSNDDDIEELFVEETMSTSSHLHTPGFRTDDHFSDDELGVWETDDTSPTRNIVLNKDVTEYSDIEIVEPSAPHPSSDRASSKQVSKSTTRNKRSSQPLSEQQVVPKPSCHLQTPPLSHTSSAPSATPSFPDSNGSDIPQIASSSVTQPAKRPFPTLRSRLRKSTQDQQCSQKLLSSHSPIPQLDFARVRRARPAFNNQRGLDSPVESTRDTSRSTWNRPTPTPKVVIARRKPIFSPSKTKPTSSSAKFVEDERHSKYRTNGILDNDSELVNKRKGKTRLDAIEDRRQPLPEEIDKDGVFDELLSVSPAPSSRRRHRTKHNIEEISPDVQPLSHSKDARRHHSSVSPEPLAKSTSASLPTSQSMSPRKRKRRPSSPLYISVSEQSDLEEQHVDHKQERNSHATRKIKQGVRSLALKSREFTHPTPPPKNTRRQRSIPTQRTPEYDPEIVSYSPENESQHHRRRRSSARPTLYGYEHPPFTPSKIPPMYPPISDPRAHYIISHAMQQLSALVGGGWTPARAHTPMPYTPSNLSDPIYSTPFHHSHPYPYYDPALSRATLPPDTPMSELLNSSRSRGRRVSFHMEDHRSSDSDPEALHIHSSPPQMRSSNKGKERKVVLRQDANEKSTAKTKTTRERTGRSRHRSESDSEGEIEVSTTRRGRPYSRAQTPGPSSHRADSSESASGIRRLRSHGHSSSLKT